MLICYRRAGGMRRTSVAFSFFTTLVLRVNYCSALFSVALLFGLLKGFGNGIVDAVDIIIIFLILIGISSLRYYMHPSCRFV